MCAICLVDLDARVYFVWHEAYMPFTYYGSRQMARHLFRLGIRLDAAGAAKGSPFTIPGPHPYSTQALATISNSKKG